MSHVAAPHAAGTDAAAAAAAAQPTADSADDWQRTNSYAGMEEQQTEKTAEYLVDGYDEDELLYDKAAPPMPEDCPTQPTKKSFLPPTHELKAVDKHCDELQLRAVKHVVTAARELSAAALEPLTKLAATHGIDADQLQEILWYIRDRAPMIIHFKLDQNDRIQKFTADTHYRNQFEVKMSNGAYQPDHSSRVGWETRLFNKIYDSAKPFQRPKYGVLNMVNDPAGIKSCSHYGDSYLIMRGVRLRSSFADQDSGNVDRVTLASCEYYNHVLARYTPEELKSIRDVACGFVAYHSGGNIRQYKEVQIHGEVAFADNVEAVVVAERHRSDTKTIDGVKAFCAKNGCRWVWMNDYQQEVERRFQKFKEAKAAGIPVEVLLTEASAAAASAGR